MKTIAIIAVVLSYSSLLGQNVTFSLTRTKVLQIEVDANEPRAKKNHLIKSDLDKSKSEIGFTKESKIELGTPLTGNVYNVVTTFDSLFSVYHQVYIAKGTPGRMAYYERPSFQYQLPKDSIIKLLDRFTEQLTATTETTPKLDYILALKLYDVPGDGNKSIIVVGQYLIAGTRKDVDKRLSGTVAVAFDKNDLFRKFFSELIGAPLQASNAELMDTAAFKDRGKSGGLDLHTFSDESTYNIYLHHR